MSVLGLLITGAEENRVAFYGLVFARMNLIDSRKQTTRFTCMSEDLETALTAAKVSDVTVQEIVTTGTKNPRQHDLGGAASVTVSDCIETYPVLYLAPHGMKWEPKPQT